MKHYWLLRTGKPAILYICQTNHDVCCADTFPRLKDATLLSALPNSKDEPPTSKLIEAVVAAVPLSERDSIQELANTIDADINGGGTVAVKSPTQQLPTLSESGRMVAKGACDASHSSGQATSTPVREE